ncbi:hypothetical protein GCM10010503_39290 [Streptomyces lucensis JCM 4490]|uniref:Uncharacterized protein n=1 Tax=Streptomyces lucensis JCM 4490 TaxID=1306176 RepID=A0A918J828_9ACTN|nr:hypothetical protein [Streptomyces lucensis]GGW58377.1 hypothetical protein GCM10010503_39290 [Streptomyces lucensis JCM 4490]
MASIVAVLRLSSRSRMVGAFEPRLYRVSAAIHAGGTPPVSTRPAPNARTSRARSKASRIALPDTRTGPVRSRSSSETRLPGGTFSRSRIACRSASGTAWSSVRYSSAISWARVSATSRVSVVIPGSSTRFSTSHTTAWSNSARGPSADAHTRAARNVRTSGSAWPNSR